MLVLFIVFTSLIVSSNPARLPGLYRLFTL
nr:MAG TPA: hypothetical protein [Caudoviricetes sp.]